MQRRSVLLIHGMFMTPLCWEEWIPYLAKKGIEAKAPAWPLHDATPAEQRKRHPDPKRGHTVRPPATAASERNERLSKRDVGESSDEGHEWRMIEHSRTRAACRMPVVEFVAETAVSIRKGLGAGQTQRVRCQRRVGARTLIPRLSFSAASVGSASGRVNPSAIRSKVAATVRQAAVFCVSALLRRSNR